MDMFSLSTHSLFWSLTNFLSFYTIQKHLHFLDSFICHYYRCSYHLLYPLITSVLFMSQKSLTWRFFTLVFFWMAPFPTCIIHIMDSVFYKVYSINSILCRILFLYYNFKFSLIVFIFIALYSINISSQSAITLKWGRVSGT